MLLVPRIPILALVIQNMTMLDTTIATRNDLISVEKSVLASNEMARLVARLQEEPRGRAHLDDVAIEDIKQLGLDIQESFLSTDSALDEIKSWRNNKKRDYVLDKTKAQTTP